MNFPAHKAGLIMEHNPHLNVYESASEWIRNQEERGCSAEWKCEEAKGRAIATNEIWTLQWYPETPIGFNIVAAPTFEELLDFASAMGSTLDTLD